MKRWRLLSSAFTLVEILVVLAITAVLVGIVYTATGPSRERGRQAVCLSNLRQAQMAFRMYLTDYDIEDNPQAIERIPFVYLIRKYQLNQLRCPSYIRQEWQTGSDYPGWGFNITGPMADFPYVETFSQSYTVCGDKFPLVLDDNHNDAATSTYPLTKIRWLVCRYGGNAEVVWHERVSSGTTDPCFTKGR